MAATPQRVFISYQRTDGEFARQVREHLVAHGVHTWMDQYDIPVGAYWPDEIDKALTAADLVIGILSPDAVESRNVKNEWDWAITHDRRLLLMMVRPTDIPHRYVSINFIDATDPDRSRALASLSRSLGVGASMEPATDFTGLAVEAETAQFRHAHRAPRPASRVPEFLAGREREQEILRHQLDRLFAGSGSLLLVGGEAGIGKTTLTGWLAAEAEGRGAVVLAGGCYDLTTTPPYGPWGEIVRGWPESGGFPSVPDALRGGEAMAQIQSQTALFELATDLLATAGTVKPLVVLLEDLHWADQASLDLLRYVSRLLAGFRLLLVGTYRDDELTRRHPLYQLLPALAREPGAERVTLQRLGSDATRDLVFARYDLSEPDAERLVTHLHAVTDGNPLFAGETLREMEESGALRREGDSWSFNALSDGSARTPHLVRQVIEGRLLRLGEDAQRQLGVAAVIGHDVPLDLWVAVSGADEDALSDTLERATEAHIVEEIPRGDGFRFTHALIRETLYDGLGLLRRRTLHRATGEALAASTRPDPDAVAHHFSRASDSRAYDWLIESSNRAYRTYAWVIAAERFEQAAALIADNPEQGREYGYLLYHAARMIRFTDNIQAVRHFDDAALAGRLHGDIWLELNAMHQSGLVRSLQGELRDGVERMAALGARFETVFRDGRMAAWTAPPVRFRNDLSMSEPMLRYALDMAVQRPEHAVVLLRSLTCVRLQAVGRYREAHELAGELAEVWPADLEASAGITIDEAWRDAWGDLHMVLADHFHVTGSPVDAERMSQIAMSIFASFQHHALVALITAWMLDFAITYRTDDVAHRRQILTDAVDAATRSTGALIPGTPEHWTITKLMALEGEWADAVDILAAGYAAYIRGTEWIAQRTAGQLVWLYARRGNRKEALRLIGLLMPSGPATDPGNNDFFAALTLIQSAASLALDTGDVAIACAWLECHDRWLAWSGVVMGQVEGHLGWVRYHREIGDLATAQEEAQTALAKASDPRQPLGLIAANRLLGEVAALLDDDDTARHHFGEALTLAEHCEAPYEIALTQTALAEYHLAVGEPDTVRLLLSAARATCERLGARPTLERIAALEARLA